jgi:hypothetical protein
MNQKERNQGRDVYFQGSRQMTSTSRRYYEMELGAGVGPSPGFNEQFGYTEPLRRFIQREGFEPQANEIPNTMPSWMPGDDYYTNFRVGDPYVKVDQGFAPGLSVLPATKASRVRGRSGADASSCMFSAFSALRFLSKLCVQVAARALAVFLLNGSTRLRSRARGSRLLTGLSILPHNKILAHARAMPPLSGVPSCCGCPALVP